MLNKENLTKEVKDMKNEKGMAPEKDKQEPLTIDTIINDSNEYSLTEIITAVVNEIALLKREIKEIKQKLS